MRRMHANPRCEVLQQLLLVALLLGGGVRPRARFHDRFTVSVRSGGVKMPRQTSETHLLSSLDFFPDRRPPTLSVCVCLN